MDPVDSRSVQGNGSVCGGQSWRCCTAVEDGCEPGPPWVHERRIGYAAAAGLFLAMTSPLSLTKDGAGFGLLSGCSVGT